MRYAKILPFLLPLAACDNYTGPERIVTTLPTCIFFCRSDTTEMVVGSQPSAQSISIQSSFAGGDGASVDGK